MITLKETCNDIAESTLEDGEIFLGIESGDLVPLIFSKEETDKRRKYDETFRKKKWLYFFYGDDSKIAAWGEGRPVAPFIMTKHNGWDWHIQRTFPIASIDDVNVGDKVVLNKSMTDTTLKKGNIFTIIEKDSSGIIRVKNSENTEYNLFYWRFNKC